VCKIHYFLLFVSFSFTKLLRAALLYAKRLQEFLNLFGGAIQLHNFRKLSTLGPPDCRKRGSRLGRCRQRHIGTSFFARLSGPRVTVKRQGVRNTRHEAHCPGHRVGQLPAASVQVRDLTAEVTTSHIGGIMRVRTEASAFSRLALSFPQRPLLLPRRPLTPTLSR